MWFNSICTKINTYLYFVYLFCFVNIITFYGLLFCFKGIVYLPQINKFFFLFCVCFLHVLFQIIIILLVNFYSPLFVLFDCFLLIPIPHFLTFHVKYQKIYPFCWGVCIISFLFYFVCITPHWLFLIHFFCLLIS